MQIEKNTVVTIDYTLTDDEGNLIDESSDGSFSYLHGASNIIPGLESALTGKTGGDGLEVAVTPDEAYGLRDETLIQVVPRTMFPADSNVAPGMRFQAEGPDGAGMVVTVQSVDHDEVTVDGNHPLASMHLNFSVRVLDVRAATAEEIEHGQAHGDEGHAHH